MPLKTPMLILLNLMMLPGALSGGQYAPVSVGLKRLVYEFLARYSDASQLLFESEPALIPSTPGNGGMLLDPVTGRAVAYYDGITKKVYIDAQMAQSMRSERRITQEVAQQLLARYALVASSRKSATYGIVHDTCIFGALTMAVIIAAQVALLVHYAHAWVSVPVWKKSPLNTLRSDIAWAGMVTIGRSMRWTGGALSILGLGSHVVTWFARCQQEPPETYHAAQVLYQQLCAHKP